MNTSSIIYSAVYWPRRSQLLVVVLLLLEQLLVQELLLVFELSTMYC